MTMRARLARPPRILLASDQNHVLWELEGFLGRAGYSVVREFSGAAVLARARTVRPDAILLDARIANPSSLDISRSLRDDALIGNSTPILLIMAGRLGRKDHLLALRAGIWEALPQRQDANELLRKLEAYVLGKAEADRVPRQSLVDDLTGLYTTHGLARRAQELIFQAARHSTSVACVVFAPELPAAPEAPLPAELVPRVAQVLHATARHSDAIGRVAAAEFAVVAPGANGVGAEKLAQRFRRAGAEPGFALRAGYDTVANLRYTPVEPTDLLARAARALQLARAEGKWVRESGEGW